MPPCGNRTIDGYEIEEFSKNVTLYRLGGDPWSGDMHHYGSELGWEIGDFDSRMPVCRLYKSRELAITTKQLDLMEEYSRLERLLIETA